MATTYTDTISLAKMATSDPFDVSLLNGNADTLDAAVKRAYQGKAAYNLLDNSDFTNPVNQRGETSYGGGKSAIDRWRTASDTSIAINDGYCTLTGSWNLNQRIPAEKFQAGKTYTAVVYWNPSENGTYAPNLTIGGSEVLFSGTYGVWNYTLVAFTYSTSDDSYVTFAIGTRGAPSTLIKWAAVYEGSYTAATLPEYVPKGYAAELTECQRYFVRYNGPSSGNALHVLLGATNGNNFFAPLRLPVPLRGNPTITYSNVNLYPYAAGSTIAVTSIVQENISTDYQTIALRVGHETADIMTAGRVCTLRIAPDGYLDLSAEL